MIEKHCFVIPNYNGALFISKTLRKAIDAETGEIIVVDDNSNDESIPIIKKFPVSLICRTENGGFAAAVNSGLREAKSRGFIYASIMNSDVELPDGFANSMREVIGNLNNNNAIAVAGFVESGTKRYFTNDKISGFFFTIKMDIIESVGFLNEEFFMYGEETEFFRRVINKGFKIVQTGIELRHFGEKSSSPAIDSSWYAIRNSILIDFIQTSYLSALKTIVILFLIINKLYKPRGSNDDPSYIRVKRVGVKTGNYYLIKAIYWNIKRIFAKTQGDNSWK